MSQLTGPLEFALLRAEFKRAVNMTPLELAAWLRTGTARAQPRAARGRRVLAVLALLARRPSQLTEADTGLMGEVVATVRAERAAGPGELPDALWRARLMCLGHDPLRS